jgi:glutathione S-transferase
MPIQLYGYATSPYVRKVGAFLYYKKLDFEFVPVSPMTAAAQLEFVGGTSVPVLVIDGEARRESSALALWLDERFPERPLCPAAERDRILAIDEWVSQTFLLSIFRGAIDGEVNLQYRFRFWRLAALVSAHTPLPEQVRHLWPDFVANAPFVKAMGEQMDLNESAQNMSLRIGMELAAHIGNGPFIGGRETPSMLDLAIFPQLVFPVMFGLEDQLSAGRHPIIRAWIERMAEHLPPNPTLVADTMQVVSLSDALAALDK